MIELLRIKNLALIDDIELEFGPGLNVLTGETGAGKSFIVGAINFLTGEKMAADLVRAGRDKATVEALFVEGGEDVILRRELNAATGRSRVTLNDQLASQDTLRVLRPKLLLHASQHGQQRLLQPSFQAALLDAFLADKSDLAEKDRLLKELAAIGEDIRALAQRAAGLEEKRQFLEFQHAEINKVNPRPGEEDELVGRRTALLASQKATDALQNALGLIEGETDLADALSRLHRELATAADHFPDLQPEAEAASEYRHRLRELAVRLRRQPRPAAEDDPEAIEKRLFALAQLKRKLKKNLDEIVTLSREIEDNLAFLDACGLDQKRLRREEADRVKRLAAVLTTVNAARREAAHRLAKALETTLAGLGFAKDVRVLFDFAPHPAYTPTTGEAPLAEDRARVLWQPNPGQPPQPLDKIASGGELSRFLLAVMSLSAEQGGPTLIFDEIDAGIGGLTLGSVGNHIKSLARASQTLLITHWPQLASLADRHFQVTKSVTDGQTQTHCRLLTGPDVAAELSRMAGGGETGKEMARRLLEKG